MNTRKKNTYKTKRTIIKIIRKNLTLKEKNVMKDRRKKYQQKAKKK